MKKNAATRARTGPADDPGAPASRAGSVLRKAGENVSFWHWLPLTGEYRSSQRSDHPVLTIEVFVATIALPDQERVIETLARVADGRAREFELDYELPQSGRQSVRMRSTGHVVERDTAGMPTRVIGITSRAECFPDNQTRAPAPSLETAIALESDSQGVWEWDVSNNRFEASAQWRRLFGYSEADIREELTDVARLAHPDDLVTTREALVGVLKGATEVYEAQQRIRHRNGHYLPCLAHARVIERDENGRALRMLGTHTDISAVIRTRRELAESNAVLNFALEHGRQGVWEWDCASDTFKHYGHTGDSNHPASRDAITSGAELIACTHPDDRDRVLKTLTAYLRGDTDDYAVEQRVALTDGSYRTFLARGRAIERTPDGQVVRVLGSSTDITDLKADHQRLHIALENGRQGMWEWNTVPDSLSFSDGWYGLYGYAKNEIPDEAIGFRERVHPDDHATVRAALVSLLKGDHDTYAIEIRLRTKQAGYMWIMDRATVLERDTAGRATLVVGTHVDISKQKAVEHELEQSRRLLGLVIDTIPSFVYWKDTRCRYLGANRSFADAVGIASPDEIIGLTDFDLPWSADAPEFQHSDLLVITNGQSVHRSDDAFTDADGERRHFDTTKTPLLDEYGEIIGVLGVSEEVTERRRYEQQLKKLAERITGAAGDRLLDALTRGAVEMSGVGSALIARIGDDGQTATIVSHYPPDPDRCGSEYVVAGSPCSQAGSGDHCIVPENARAAYPHDRCVTDLDAEAYLGRRLVDRENRPVGFIALYDTNPIRHPHHAVSVLDILAATAAAELQRESREIALRESELRYRTTFDNVPVMICTLDAAGIVIDANEAWKSTTGHAAQSTIGRPLRSFFAAASLAAFDALGRGADTQTGQTDPRLELTCSDGRILLVSCNIGHLQDSTTNAAAIAVLEDVSAQRFAEQQLRLAATAFETHEALVIRDAHKRILRVNNAYKQITGYQDHEVVGRLPEHLERGTEAGPGAEIWDAVDSYGQWDGERVSYRADGSSYAAWQTITAVRDVDGKITHYVENSTDISELKNALAEAEKLALFDPLTSLPNRRYLAEQLEAGIAHARRNAVKGALLFIDLDQFKHINDSLGHNVGDGLLVQVAKRLKRLMRKEDTIARLGGDEFVIVLANLGNDNAKCVEQARRVADKVHHELGKTYEVDSHEFSVTPTIGVTLFPDEGKTVETILQEADSAMYRGKADGRNTTKFFHPSMQSETQTRLGLERDLRTAAERDELSLCFQPQYDRAGVLFAAEVLLRWTHPARGPVAPDVFIPIAEKSGLIVELGHWVFTNAFDCLRRWERDRTLAVDHLSINASCRQLRAPAFVPDICRQLVAAGTPADRLVIEVTEGTIIDDVEDTARCMQKLRESGARFSVDDFGSGYSSLSCLSRLPIDRLKIDRSIVAGACTDADGAVITETIIGMGRNLGIQTLAEGVETRAQLELLHRQGCDGFQGHFLSEPLAEREFLKLPRTVSLDVPDEATGPRRTSS